MLFRSGDSGYYTCTITNIQFPELTLLSDTSRLNVLIPVGIDDFNNAQINIYPNPAEKQIFVETGNNPVNLKLFDITGTLLFQKNNFISGWIKIETFSRGIYIVRITSQNSETHLPFPRRGRLRFPPPRRGTRVDGRCACGALAERKLPLRR